MNRYFTEEVIQMTIRHTKKYLFSFILGEMQIKVRVRSHIDENVMYQKGQKLPVF